MSRSGENNSETESICGSVTSSLLPEEDEAMNDAERSDQFANLFGSFEPYQDEPDADEEWMADYNRERQEEIQRNEELEERLLGRREINSW